MRKLHVVGFTSDLDGLIFSTRKGAKSGSFVVAIGEELMEKLDEVQRLRNGDIEGGPHGPARREERERRARPESLLTPREIQARLRAGRTIDEVAREAGVDTDWVERFAAPILAEQRQVVELARSLTYSKPRLGESAEPVGESVAANLADRGLWVLEDEFESSWSAFQLRDGVWTVRFRYRSRGRQQQATWDFDVANNRLIARDRLASDLGYVERARRRRRLAESADEAAAEVMAEASPVVVRVPARRSTATTTPTTSGRSRPAGAKGRAPAKPAAVKAKKASRDRVAKAPAARPAAGRTRTPKAAAVKAAVVKAKKAAKPARAATVAKAPRTRTAAPAPARAARTRAQTTKGRGGERSTPAPPAGAASEAPARPRRPPRPLAPRPPGPKFGTDGSRLGTPSSGTLGRRRPGAPPLSPPARRAPSPEPPPARSQPRPSRPPLTEPGTGNGAGPVRRAAAPAPAPVPPPERRRPPAPRPAPPPPPLPPEDDLEFDLDLDDIELDLGDDDDAAVSEPAPAPEREPERERRPSIAIGPPPGEDSSEDRNGGEEDGAFVIRPRISARQASELRFDSESPRRWKPPLKDITAVPPVALPAQL